MAGTAVWAGAVLAASVAIGLAGCTAPVSAPGSGAAAPATSVSPATTPPPATVSAATPGTAGSTAAPVTASTSTTPATTATASATPAGVDRDFGRQLRLDGSRLTYDQLVWYTGAAAGAVCRQQQHQDCVTEYTTEDLHAAASGTVDASTRITLLAQQSDGIRPVPGSLSQLAAAVRDPRWSPYWRIQRDGDHVTSIEHVYVP